MKFEHYKNKIVNCDIFMDLGLWLILIAAFALRIYLASIPTYLWDESMDWIPLAKSINVHWGRIHLPIRGDFHPALSAYFIRSGIKLFGQNPIGFRFFGVLAGLLTIIVAARLTLDWFGLKAARWTAILLGFNEYHIAVSALATQEVFYLLFAILAMYFFSRFLRTENPNHLYISAAMIGLGFLCYEIILLLIPAYFATIVFSRYRPWLRRKEPYIAGLVFLLVISPDLYWNLTTTDHVQVSLIDQLSRVGGLGFNPHYLLFYVGEAVSIIGYVYHDGFAEYPKMNPLFGVILLAGVFLITLRIKRSESILKFLIFAFWIGFGFFLFTRPGTGVQFGDALGWLWVDMTLLPAVILTGYYLSSLRKNLRIFAYIATGAAVLYATVMVVTIRLGLPFFADFMETQGIYPEGFSQIEIFLSQFGK